MRIQRAITLGAALTALLTVSGCGSDSATENLPSAGDMAAIEKFVNQYTGCQGLELDPEDEDEESTGKEWGIKERAECESGDGDDIVLLSIDNMQQFQNKTKEVSAEANDLAYLIGQDFALRPEDGDAVQALKPAGLLLFTCDKDFKVPSGYKNEKAMAEGCLMTDYIPS
ncbi:hypothetical protein [Streptomyces sp. NPDC000410]|uniref:hypothetical protein n=1 Tax=Streptomyces sp. NPDC000410 TaxID=3154254 RepID=UPI00331FBC61